MKKAELIAQWWITAWCIHEILYLILGTRGISWKRKKNKLILMLLSELKTSLNSWAFPTLFLLFHCPIQATASHLKAKSSQIPLVWNYQSLLSFHDLCNIKISQRYRMVLNLDFSDSFPITTLGNWSSVVRISIHPMRRTTW